MPTKIYWIKTFDNAARLGIMARPRGDDWLDDEIASLKKQKVDYLVSLLESSESEELGLRSEGITCTKYGIGFVNFPIPDRSIPDNQTKTDTLIDTISSKIDAGYSIVVHCRMGIGRSSIIAGSILLEKENYPDAKEIIDRITIIRGLKVPDTDDQMKWLQKREERRT